MPRHSKKDYELVAGLIAGWAEQGIGAQIVQSATNVERLTGHQIMVRDAAAKFAADNPAFKPRLFARVAGLSEFSIGVLFPKAEREAANSNTRKRKAA